MFKRLWNDEMGAIVSAEIVLVMTILVIAMVTGLASVRDAVVTELADVGAAIGVMDQSYTVGGVLAHSAATAGSAFFDTADFCDTTCSPVNSGTRCLNITGPAIAFLGNEGIGTGGVIANGTGH